MPINDIQRKDRGIYKCLAINLVGYGDVWTLKVNVKCKHRSGESFSFSSRIRFSSAVHPLSVSDRRPSSELHGGHLRRMLRSRLPATSNLLVRLRELSFHNERIFSSRFFRYKNDYGGQISSMMSVDVLRPIWNSYKYKIEATIPEPNICTDCILSRLTIINVEASDLGSYVINATTNEKPYRTALDSVFIFGKTS